MFSPLLAEYVGAFFFILAIFASHGNPLIVGGALALVVYLIGAISGGHVNPAVSTAMWLDSKISTAKLMSYVAAQLLGGMSAYATYRFVRR